MASDSKTQKYLDSIGEGFSEAKAETHTPNQQGKKMADSKKKYFLDRVAEWTGLEAKAEKALNPSAKVGRNRPGGK